MEHWFFCANSVNYAVTLLMWKAMRPIIMESFNEKPAVLFTLMKNHILTLKKVKPDTIPFTFYFVLIVKT